MNLEIFKKKDPSGRMSKEQWVKKNYPKEYEHIIQYSLTNNLEDLPFSQKVFHIINNINNKPTCVNLNCNNFVNFKNKTIGYYKYCSKKCVSSDPNIKKKKEEKSYKKYGTKTPSQNTTIKNKIKKTNLEKYGYNTPLKNLKIKEKSKQTLLKKYQVDNISKNSKMLKKRVDTFKKNINKWKVSFKKTSLKKYGVTHPWKNKNIHLKTIKSRYKSEEKKIIKRLKESKANDIFIEYLYNADSDNLYKIQCYKCKENYKINNNNFLFRLYNNYELCTKCNPVGTNYNISHIEKKFIEYIQSINNGLILNSRKIIYPYELDVFIPNKNIAFEFNGLYWHSEINKNKKYHYNKTMQCEKKGIELIHIWEDDWMYKQDIIKSIIKNKLGVIKEKIYARKCIIQEIDNKDYKNFLENNHIQGYSTSKIKIGLFYKNELVSVMSFSGLRKSMNHTSKEKSYELIRFCNKIDTIIVGSASKIFKYFINKYNPETILSYSDNSMFKGHLYEKLGFKYDGETQIGYHWVLNKKRHHRFNYRKSKLVSMGYSSNKTEREIMYEDVGAYRIWNCKQKRWVWENNYL